MIIELDSATMSFESKSGPSPSTFASQNAEHLAPPATFLGTGYSTKLNALVRNLKEESTGKRYSKTWPNTHLSTRFADPRSSALCFRAGRRHWTWLSHSSNQTV